MSVEAARASPRAFSWARHSWREWRPLVTDEAALLLSEDENSFLVFRNAETQKIAVIYKRKDKNYGLIEP